MSGPWQPASDDAGVWHAPMPRSSAPVPPGPDDSDFVLRESWGTHREALPGDDVGHDPGDEPPRRPIRDSAQDGVFRLLTLIESHRLRSVLNGASVLNVGTEYWPSYALRHRHWLGLSGRLFGVAVALVVACLVSPPFLALCILAGAHWALIVVRRGVDRHWSFIIAGSEFVVGSLLGAYVGPGWLRAGLILAVLVVLVMTVVAWRVDMELVTDERVLVRTRGLFLFKRTMSAPLSSIRIAAVTGPFWFLGFVSVDTTSDRDQLLHNFGLIAYPDGWASILLRLATRSVDQVEAAHVD